MTTLGPCGLAPALSREEWENAVAMEAAYFTCVIYRAMHQSLRTEYPTMREAVTAAKGKPRSLVYAVHESGRSVHISPKDYDRLLAARGETP